MEEEYFLVRTSISHFYEKGTGCYATPKLYRKGSAVAVCNRRNKIGRYGEYKPHPSDGPFEVVPVTLVVGKPLNLEKKGKKK